MNSDNPFEKALRQNAVTLLDGGLATEIEAQGHDISGSLWSAKMLITNPQAIVDAHLAYLEAGAQCIITASYQASYKSLTEAGVPEGAMDRVIAGSVELAVTARQQFMDANPEIDYVPVVAASIGPYGAALHNGAEYTGEYDTDEQGLQEFHQRRLGVLDASAADVLAVETIPHATEAAVLCAMLKRCTKPSWVSFCCRDGKHLSDSTLLRDSAALFAGHPRVRALGVNCTSPEYVASLIGEIKRSAPDKAIVVYPNSGETYESATNTWHGTVSPVECADASLEWRDAGATLIGGCCRMGPQHIAAIKQQLEATR
ncbi:MAG: homocysteine S-methyltransferase [Gammaproteobacteria bacterium]|nr:homocysteine S-methyltransferase [Gammaproteobacteria bacterium]